MNETMNYDQSVSLETIIRIGKYITETGEDIKATLDMDTYIAYCKEIEKMIPILSLCVA